MKPGRLLIRADASLAIGTGHVMRCLALAQAWRDSGGSVGLAVAELPDALAPRFIGEGVSLNRVHGVPGSSEDAAETIVQARKLMADWVVVDGDRFDSCFLETVQAAALRVLLIDDFAERKTFPVDLIVNPNLFEDEREYRRHGATMPLLMGASYILLRREFRERTETQETPQNGNRILVTLGGSDPENLTPKIAHALACCPDLEITVIAGAAYDKADVLRMLKASNLRVVFNPANMVEFMKDSDQAIIAAGGTLWELLSVGCAILSYSRNSVQARVVSSLSQRGVVVDMGETRSFDAARLVASVKELAASRMARDTMTRKGRALADGLGAARVVEAMHRSGGK